MPSGAKASIKIGDVFDNFTVVDYIDYRNVLVECSVCHTDKVLWYKPIKIDSRQLRKGVKPCSCGKPFWDEQQYKTLLERKFENSNYSIVNIPVEPSSRTIIDIHCSLHGTISRREITRILNDNNGMCNMCSAESVRKVHTLDTGILQQRFYNIFNDERYEVIGKDTVKCHVCAASEDCDVSIFKFDPSLLKRSVPCRCAKGHKFSKQEVSSYIQRLRLKGYIIEDEPEKWNERFYYHCPNGHYHSTSLKTIFTLKQGCRFCWEDNRDYGFYPNFSEREDFLYLAEVYDNDTLLCYKIGRSFNLKGRMSALTCDSGYTFKVLKYTKGKHLDIYKREQALLKKFDKFTPDKRFKGSGECICVIKEVIHEFES